MKHLEEHSNEEIAAMLDDTVENVKVRTFRARQMFKLLESRDLNTVLIFAAASRTSVSDGSGAGLDVGCGCFDAVAAWLLTVTTARSGGATSLPGGE